MKKKILIIVSITIVLCVVIGIIITLNYNKVSYGKEAFYLESDLYNTKNNYEEINISKFNKLQKEKKSYVLFTYTSYCPFSTPSDEIFKSVFKKNKMKLYAINYEELKNTDVVNTIKYAPSVIIIKEGKIVSYLNAEADEDFDRYQNKKEFNSWLAKYIYLSLKK